MNYQEIIETAHNMTQNPRILAALEDGALLSEKECEWSQMTPDEIIADIEYEITCSCGRGEIGNNQQCDKCAREEMKMAKAFAELNIKYCRACFDFEVSSDPEIAADGLCDRCNREINEDAEIIGWRKGE